jgi:hypothetical protein
VTVERIADLIRGLDLEELARLRRLLDDLPGFGTTGVREPRRPSPESGETAAEEKWPGEDEFEDEYANA